MKDWESAIDEAEKRVRKSNRQLMRDTDLDTVSAFFVDVGRCDEALALARKIRDKETRQLAFEYAGDCMEEAASLEEAIRQATKKKRARKRDSARVRVVELYAEAGHMNEALSWCAEITSPFDRIAGLMFIVEHSLKRDDHKGALASLDEMSAIYEKHKNEFDIFAVKTAVNMMAKRYLRARADERALHYYREVKMRAMDPEQENNWRWLTTCKNVAEG